MANTLGALAAASIALLILGLSSGYIKNRLFVSEPLIALLVGAVLGPAASGLLDYQALGFEGPLVLLEYGALITLALSVMGAALRLPKSYMREHAGELARVLTAGMLLMALSSAVVVWALLPVPLLAAALVGAVVAPTDPVLSDSIVTGKGAERYIPARLRYTIGAESGANDGLAVVLVMLPMLLLTQPAGAALSVWLCKVLFAQVLGGLLLGVAIGIACGIMLQMSGSHPTSERMSLLTVGISLAFSVLALSELLQVNGVLATFAAGVALNYFLGERQEEVRQEHLQEAFSRFFDLPIMILFGAFLPWQEWQQMGAAGMFAALLILLLRRMPAWQLMWRILPSLHSRRDALFTGWFGPIGIAALYYALMIREHDGPEVVWPLVSLVVCASIVIHGISATPFTRCYPAFAMNDAGARDD